MTDLPGLREFEIYSQRDNPAFEAEMRARTAADSAAFFLRYLHRGMRLLDAGCGPGSITVGLAAAVEPGEAVGIDLQLSQVELARAFTAERNATVRFETADVYRLPFADHSFDAAFAHGVLMHLRQPVQALAELRRVLRPGGVIGVRDPDWDADIITPETPLLAHWRRLRIRIRQHNGSDPFLGRRHRQLLREAGFAPTEATASVTHAGSAEQVRCHASWLKAQVSGLARTAVAEGWLDQHGVDALMAEIDAWAETADAFAAAIWCEAVGWS